MAEITIPLSGPRGLAPYFSGDADRTVPEPNLRFAGEGQMVDGFYNPFLRYGYLAPTTTTKVDVTKNTTPDTFFGSSHYDNVEDEYYLAERGRRIYKGGGLDDESLTEVVELPADSIIHDLEVYQLNGSRKLFYTYEKSGTDVTLLTRSSVDAELFTVGARVDGVSGRPLVSYRETRTIDVSSFEQSVEVPSSSDVMLLVFVSGLRALDNVSINASNFTKEFSTTHTIANSYPASESFFGSSSEYVFEVWSYKGPPSGVQDITVTPGASGFNTYSFLILENADSVHTVASNYNLGTTVGVDLPNNVDSLYLQNTLAHDSYWNVTGSTYVSTEQDLSANIGTYQILPYFCFGDDGTKLYVVAIDSDHRIYQFNLSTAWDITSANTTPAGYLQAYAPANTPFGIGFSADGTKFFTSNPNDDDIVEYSLSTAWDISTGSISAIRDTPVPGFFSDFVFSEDGLSLYTYAESPNEEPGVFLWKVEMGTAFDLSDISALSAVEVPMGFRYSSVDTFLDLANNDRVLYIKGSSDQDPIFRVVLSPDSDITKAVFDGDLSSASTTNGGSIALHPDGSYWYKIRDTGNREIRRYTMPEGAKPSLSSVNTKLTESSALNNSTTLLASSSSSGFAVDVGHESIPSGVSEESWLIGKKSENITSSSRYNFLRKADNGFAYLFTDSRVHKIDGTVTGGTEGFFTRDVLRFPDYFTISDAVDYRSQMYIAVNKADLDLSSVNRGNYTGGAYVYVWDRNTVQLSAATSIEIPGIRSIKKIYPGPDGHLKIIVINDAGLTELRRFGYNDSGSAVFSEAVELGLGAHPQYPDGGTVVGDKTVWLANNGVLFGERDMSIFKLQEVESMASVPGDTILSGAILFGSGVETADSGYRTDKQGVIMSYEDGTSTAQTKKSYLFDIKTGSNASQTANVGNVYTGINYIPVTSKVERVRIYNAPITTSTDDTIATVKLYFNQSTDPTVPNGMTKTVTKKEAARGYVDFSIKKPYVHSLQIEIEWNTSEPIGEDMYLPSIAVVSTEETEVATPDND